jgi:hypothetical protein
MVEDVEETCYHQGNGVESAKWIMGLMKFIDFSYPKFATKEYMYPIDWLDVL